MKNKIKLAAIGAVVMAIMVAYKLWFDRQEAKETARATKEEDDKRVWN